MNRKALDKLWSALEAARKSPQTAADLEALARMCGRRERVGGNHPIWITDHFAHRPLPIPRHGGNRNVAPYAKKVILNGLEADAAAWEDILTGGRRNGGTDGTA
jgi:hypothetical protein